MSAKAKTTKPASRERGIVLALEAIMRMRGDMLQAVVPLLTDLANVDDGALREPSLRRLALRMFCVLRYQQLRRSPEHRHLCLPSLAAEIGREAARIDSTWTCSERSLQSWVRAWNGIAGDGVAAGWRGLIRPTWIEQSESAGRSSARSPEAIAFFRRRYLDGRARPSPRVTGPRCTRPSGAAGVGPRRVRLRGLGWPVVEGSETVGSGRDRRPIEGASDSVRNRVDHDRRDVKLGRI